MRDAIAENGVLIKYIGNQQSVEIPEGITHIDAEAFRDCTSVVRITVPHSLVYIGEKAFLGCASLEELHIADLAAWCNADIHCTLPVEWRLYHKGQQLSCLEIPQGVTAIRKRVFRNCRLSRVVVPEGTEHIGESAFENCRGLQSVELPTTLRKIGVKAFADCYDLKYVALSETVPTIIYVSAFYNCRRIIRHPVQWGNSKYRDRSLLTLCNPAFADYETPQGEYLCYAYYGEADYERIIAQGKNWQISYTDSETRYDGSSGCGHEVLSEGLLDIPTRIIVVEDGNFSGVVTFADFSHRQMPLPQVEAVVRIRDWKGEKMRCGGCLRSYEDGSLEHNTGKEYHLCKRVAAQ